MYKVLKLKAEDMSDEIKVKLSFWANPVLLDIYSKRDAVNYYYLCVSNNDTILAIIPIFEKKKFGLTYLNQLNAYFYTPIDFMLDTKLSVFQKQNERLSIMKAYSNYLKKHYLKVILSFDPEVQDIRAFKWSGFNVEPMYTYRKEMSGYNRDGLPSISKDKLKKADKANLNVQVIWDTKIISILLLELCNRKNLSNYLTEKNYLIFLDELNEIDLCTKLVVYQNDKPIAYWIILKDYNKKVLYSLSLAGSEKGNNLGAQALCIDYIFTHLSNFETYDFCGANVESVAYFKSQFNCDLVNYYRIKNIKYMI